MTQWVFAKIDKDKVDQLIVMFEMGQFRKPVAILDRYDIAHLVKEYGLQKILQTIKEMTW